MPMAESSCTVHRGGQQERQQLLVEHTLLQHVAISAAVAAECCWASVVLCQHTRPQQRLHQPTAATGERTALRHDSCIQGQAHNTNCTLASPTKPLLVACLPGTLPCYPSPSLPTILPCQPHQVVDAAVTPVVKAPIHLSDRLPVGPHRAPGGSTQALHLHPARATTAAAAAAYALAGAAPVLLPS